MLNFFELTDSNINLLGELIDDIAKTDSVDIDIETTGLNPFVSKLLLVQLAVGGKIYILNCLRLNPRVIKYIIQLIKDSNKLVTGHNLKFELKFILAKFYEIFTNVHDTFLAEQIINAGTGRKFYSLNNLTQRYCDAELDKSVRDTFIDAVDIEVFTQEQLIYAAQDVVYLQEIREKQLELLREKKSTKIYNLEMSLLPVVAEMEISGITVDVKRWKKLNDTADSVTKDYATNIIDTIIPQVLSKIQFKSALDVFDALNILTKSKRTKKKIKELEEITEYNDIQELVKQEINLGSAKQLLSCFRILGFAIEDTNEKTINKLDSPLINDILTYREYSKKKSAFGENILTHIDPATNKIHTSFNQIGTATGRFSSERPNLQNQERESNYRSCFVADPGYLLITADYSQAELRLLGDVSQESKFLLAFEEDQDLHLETAIHIFGLPRDKITKELRQTAKNINFAVVYGSSEWGLYRNFGIPIEEGRKLLAKHRETYPDLYRFVDAMGSEICRRFYSITPYGRRRYFKIPEITGDYRELVKIMGSIKRRGINHIIQGGSADITKLALVNLYYNNPFGRDNFKILLTVHDEIVIMVKENLVEQAVLFVKETMNDAGNLIMRTVKSKVDTDFGESWSKN